MDLLKAYVANAIGTSVADIRALYDFGDHITVVTQDGKKHRVEPQQDRPEPSPIRWRVEDPDALISDHVWELLNAHYEHADAVYEADNEDLLKIPGIGKATLKNIRDLIGPPIEPEPNASGGGEPQNPEPNSDEDNGNENTPAGDAS